MAPTMAASSSALLTVCRPDARLRHRTRPRSAGCWDRGRKPCKNAPLMRSSPHAAVGPAPYPHLFPQIAGAQMLENDRSRTVPNVAFVKEIDAFAHVVHLRGQDQGFALRQVGRFTEPGGGPVPYRAPAGLPETCRKATEGCPAAQAIAVRFRAAPARCNTQRRRISRSRSTPGQSESMR